MIVKSNIQRKKKIQFIRNRSIYVVTPGGFNLSLPTSILHPLVWIGFLGIVSMFGVLQRPPVFPINLTYVSFALVAVVTTVHVFIFGGRVRIVWTFADSLMLILFVLSFVSSILASFLYDFPLNLTESGAATFLGTLILYFLTRDVLRRRQDIYWLIGILMVGFAIQFAITLYFFFSDPSGASLARLSPELSLLHTTSFEVGRFSGFFGNPNAFATLPCLALPPLVVMYVVEKRYIRSMLLSISIGISVLVLLISFSRSAWLGAIASLLILGWALLKTGHKNSIRQLLTTIFITLIILIAFSSVYQSVSGIDFKEILSIRFDSIPKQESQGNRFSFWSHALYTMFDYPTGVGLGNIKEASGLVWSPYLEAQGRNVHSSLIAIALEGSFAAGAVYAGLFIYQILSSFFLRCKFSQDKLVSYSMSASLLAFSIHSSVHAVHQFTFLWILLACHVSLNQLAKRELR